MLGGEGANRLHRVLRSERGLTYGASADTEGRKLAGDIVAETDTRTDTTGEALRLMVQEFARLQQQRVPERELTDAQAYLAGSFPLTIESPNDIATQVINYVLYELPLEDIPTYTQRITAITPDDIQRVAQTYLARSALRRARGQCEGVHSAAAFPWPDGRRDHSSRAARSDVGVAEARNGAESVVRAVRTVRIVRPFESFGAFATTQPAALRHAGQSAPAAARQLPRRRTIARHWTCSAASSTRAAA